jgi:hypothetical protein
MLLTIPVAENAEKQDLKTMNFTALKKTI